MIIPTQLRIIPTPHHLDNKLSTTTYHYFQRTKKLCSLYLSTYVNIIEHIIPPKVSIEYVYEGINTENINWHEERTYVHLQIIHKRLKRHRTNSKWTGNAQWITQSTICHFKKTEKYVRTYGNKLKCLHTVLHNVRGIRT